MSKKQKKIFKIIVIILAIVLVAELVYFGIRYYNMRKSSTFYSVVNSAVLDDDKNYVGVGFSDYRYSDFNDYDNGYNKATIFNYKDGKVVNEVGFKRGYNSYFNDVIEVSDGYVAIGSVEMTKDQKDDGLSEGLIVKYDKSFKMIWRKNVRGIGKTELLKIKPDGDDYIVVGTSVYGEGYMGNHKTGGGILIKFDKDGNELKRTNNGGPFNGKFNDVLIEKDGYVVVGLGKSNSGIIIKYDKSFDKKWSGSYGYTDKNGITGIVKFDDKYVTSTTKIVNAKSTNTSSAAIVVFDDSGNKVDDVKYSSNTINYFADVNVVDDSIIAVGYTGKGSVTDAVIVKYDKDLYEEESNIIKGNKNDYFSNVYLKDDSIYVLGYSNSKLDGFNLNGYDYFPIVKKYNTDLK